MPMGVSVTSLNPLLSTLLIDALFPSHMDKSGIACLLFVLFLFYFAVFFVCLFSLKLQTLLIVSRIVPKGVPLTLGGAQDICCSQP